MKTDKQTREKRIIERDNLSIEKFIERDNACPIYNEEEFDVIIKNNKQEEIRKMVKNLYDKSTIYRKL